MISVVVPVYNTEKYLDRCLDSILNSTCQDFEMILINDGSTDRSQEICGNYSKIDKRIKLLNQDHQGVSAARNRGIDESRGEWIVFVDSDDCIADDFLETITRQNFQEQDLLLFDNGQTGKGDKSGRPKGNGQGLSEVYYTAKDSVQIIEKMLFSQQLIQNGNVNLRSPSAKAYKKTRIDQWERRFYPDLFIGEDKIFNIEYLLQAEKVAYMPRTVYFVRWRPESATHCFQQELIRNNHIFQMRLKCIMEQNGVWDLLEKAYYENVLATMTEVLVNGIFDPRSKKSNDDKRKLCEEVHEESFFLQAMKNSGKTGNIPRKVLLFFFYLKYYGIVNIICKLSYLILRMIKR